MKVGRPLIDISGRRYGRLVVLRRSGTCYPIRWNCKCDCGNTKVVRGTELKCGNTKSCGCIQMTQNGAARRGRQIPEYAIYCAAKSRCSNPKKPEFHNYGGRGIEFRFDSFNEFISEIGFRPNRRMTLDRINNDGHYERGNIRWASRLQQARNTRIYKNKHAVANA